MVTLYFLVWNIVIILVYIFFDYIGRFKSIFSAKMSNFSIFLLKKQSALHYFDHFFKKYRPNHSFDLSYVHILQRWPSLFTFGQFRSIKLMNWATYRVQKSIFSSIVNVKNRPGSYRIYFFSNFSQIFAISHCLCMLEKQKNITYAPLCVN